MVGAPVRAVVSYSFVLRVAWVVRVSLAFDVLLDDLGVHGGPREVAILNMKNSTDNDTGVAVIWMCVTASLGDMTTYSDVYGFDVNAVCMEMVGEKRLRFESFGNLLAHPWVCPLAFSSSFLKSLSLKIFEQWAFFSFGIFSGAFASSWQAHHLD